MEPDAEETEGTQGKIGRIDFVKSPNWLSWENFLGLFLGWVANFRGGLRWSARSSKKGKEKAMTDEFR